MSSGSDSYVNITEINNNEIVTKKTKYRPPEKLFDLIDEENRYLYRRLTHSKYADRLNNPAAMLSTNKMPSPHIHQYVEPWYAKAKAEHKALIETKNMTKKPTNNTGEMNLTSIIHYMNLNNDEPTPSKKKIKKHKHACKDGSARCFEFKRRRNRSPKEFHCR